MIPLPRRGIRIIGIWITIPVLALTYLISLLTSSNSSSTIASDSPAARAVKNRIGLTAEREQGIIDKWEGVKRYAQDSAGSGLNMIGLGGEEGGEDDDWFLERERLEKEKTDARRNSKSRKPSSNTLDSQSRSTFPNHTYNPNGLLFLNPEGRHPIYDLIARGKKEWEEKHAKQSTTLDEAVKEYRNRYHRNPPRGFDKWWDYVEKHNVPLPDEYDMIHRDLQPFHGMSSTYLLSLQQTWESTPGSYVLECNPQSHPRPSATQSKFDHSLSPKEIPAGCHLAHSTYKGNDEERRVGHERAAAQLSLLKEVEGFLEGQLRVTFYAHDGPFQMIGHDYKSSLADAAAVDEHINPHEHEHDIEYRGWAAACAPHQPLNEADLGQLPSQQSFWEGEKSFIWDHEATMDPCKHPYLTQGVGFFAAFGKGPWPEKDLYPVLSMCSTYLHADVTAVSMEAFVEGEIVGDVPWEEKDEETLLWRGSTTGILFQEKSPWNISQRARLVMQANAGTGQIPLLSSTDARVAVGPAKDVSVAPLNDLLLDIGFAGKPIQCTPAVCEQMDKEYEFKARMPFDAAYKHKYLLDIDGNGFSARYKRLISTNSLILKETTFPEWYQDRIQPWVHYVPVKTDLTDLYDIMGFFRGTEPGGKDGHDAMAKEIAVEGKKWSQTYWRKEDMVAYQFRMFLELARLMAQDRSSMDYEQDTYY